MMGYTILTCFKYFRRSKFFRLGRLSSLYSSHVTYVKFLDHSPASNIALGNVVG